MPYRENHIKIKLVMLKINPKEIKLEKKHQLRGKKERFLKMAVVLFLLLLVQQKNKK